MPRVSSEHPLPALTGRPLPKGEVTAHTGHIHLSTFGRVQHDQSRNRSDDNPPGSIRCRPVRGRGAIRSDTPRQISTRPLCAQVCQTSAPTAGQSPRGEMTPAKPPAEANRKSSVSAADMVRVVSAPVVGFSAESGVSAKLPNVHLPGPRKESGTRSVSDLSAFMAASHQRLPERRPITMCRATSADDTTVSSQTVGGPRVERKARLAAIGHCPRRTN